MIKAKILMGMPIIVEVVDSQATENDIKDIFKYFEHVDNKFSTYKSASEISKINSGVLKPEEYSDEMKEVLEFCEQTKKETNGFFDIQSKDKLDPSGLVKGWAIQNAVILLKNKGFINFYVDAGGDIQASGLNKEGNVWSVGIRNPFKYEELVKILYLKNMAVATSGTYARGQHIYNPKKPGEKIEEIVSLTVIGPNIYDSDRFATAAFAMGRQGINFIENLKNFEGYMIDNKGVATYTSGFDKFTKQP